MPRPATIATADIPQLAVKLTDLSFDEARPGYFRGRASVYNEIDSYGDVVLPGSFTKTIAENGGHIKVLAQHDTWNVIGLAMLEDGPDGLWCEGQLELELPSAQEMYVRLKKGLIDGISIGYETIKERFDKGIRYILEVRLWEISLVTFPACGSARVTAVKQLQRSATRVMSELAEEIKAGRMISATNRNKLQAAYDAMQAACGPVKELLDASAPTEEEDDEPKSTDAPAPAAPPVASEPEPDASLIELHTLVTRMRGEVSVK